MTFIEALALVFSISALIVAMCKRPVETKYVEIRGSEEAAKEIKEFVSDLLLKEYDLDRCRISYQRSIGESIRHLVADKIFEDIELNKWDNERVVSYVHNEIMSQYGQDVEKKILSFLTEDMIDEIVARIKRKQL